MPDYEICYLNNDGALAGKFTAACHDDREAKILAHAMLLPGTKSFEVWVGARLIYERPQHYGLLDLHIALPANRVLNATR